MYEHPQGVFLKIGAGIGRMSVRIESAFVADAQTVGVVAADMRTGLCHGTERLLYRRSCGYNSDNLRRRSPGAGGLLSSHVRCSYGHSG